MTPGTPAPRGRALRKSSPRSEHGRWRPAADRPDVVELLQRQAETRIPELVPVRNGRMLASPFAFFRGAAAVMAADLSRTPVSGLRVQLCGDAHLANFGGFAAPDRRLVFDLNDFDETYPGPWEWDVKRLAASCVVAGRDRGFDVGARRDATLSAVAEYRRAMRTFAGMRTIDVWYARLEIEQENAQITQSLGRSARKKLDKSLAKAWHKDSLRAFAKLTHLVDGRPRIVSDPPLIVPVEELFRDERGERVRDELLGLLGDYRRSLAPDRQLLLDGYRLVDIARKVVGVGSVGMQAWIVLLLGNGDADPLFLQIKEAERLGPRAVHQRSALRQPRPARRRRVSGWSRPPATYSSAGSA